MSESVFHQTQSKKMALLLLLLLLQHSLFAKRRRCADIMHRRRVTLEVRNCNQR
jgi:hypothetical protein